MRLPIANVTLARAIAASSGGAVHAGDGVPVVEAAQITIDLAACAVALGRALTAEERETLSCRELANPDVVVYRLLERVYLSSRSGRGELTLWLPRAMTDTLRANATARNKTLHQLVAEALDYYLSTFGDAVTTTAAAVAARHADLTYQRGQRPGPPGAAKGWVTHPHDRPPYPDHLVPTPRPPRLPEED